MESGGTFQSCVSGSSLPLKKKLFFTVVLSLGKFRFIESKMLNKVALEVSTGVLIPHHGQLLVVQELLSLESGSICVFL